MAGVANGNAEDHRKKDIQRQTSGFLHKDTFGRRLQIGSSALGLSEVPCQPVDLPNFTGENPFVVAYSRYSKNIEELFKKRLTRARKVS